MRMITTVDTVATRPALIEAEFEFRIKLRRGCLFVLMTSVAF